MTQSSLVSDLRVPESRVFISEEAQARFDLKENLGYEALSITPRQLAELVRGRTLGAELKNLFSETDRVVLLGLEPPSHKRDAV